MIELKNISKSYNGIPVLQDISMTFRDNGCYCLMSPSGSGKTTLMRILMGLEQPDTGTVRIYGQDGVLVMDEPFTGMDEELKHSVIAYIREKQAGRILILSTHQEEDVKLIGGELVRITSMNIRHL